MNECRVYSDGVEGTARIAAALAATLAEGDVVLLRGDLAAGKTTFVKAVAAALGSTDLVTSPTFTLAQFYSSPAGPVLHVDAYRLEGPEEFRDLALDEHMASSITFVEWGDIVGTELPGSLAVEIRVLGDDARDIVFSGGSARWDGTVAELRRVLAEPAVGEPSCR